MSARTGLLAGIAVAAAGLFVAAPASSGPEGLAMTGSKHEDGPFSNDSVDLKADVGEAKNAWFKVKNRTNDKVKSIRLGADYKTKGVKISIFHGDDNVTNAAESMGGYKFTLDGDRSTKFRARVKITDDPGIACLLVAAEKAGVGDDGGYATVNTDC